MARYVYSTLSSPVSYDCDGHMIRIEGGANIPNKYMLTPLGVVTNITDEEASALEQNRVFQIHKANGVVRIEAKKAEVEAVVSGMEADVSAPDTEADAEKVEKKTGTKTRTKAD